MFGNAFTGWHALILLAIILLLFGAPKLPALARSLGQSMKIFKSEIKQPTDETGPASDELRPSDDLRPSDEKPSDPDPQPKP